MAKRTHYLGGHSQEGSTTGFAGWGARSPQGKTRRLGLADTAPAFNPEAYGLMSADEVEALRLRRDARPLYPIKQKKKKKAKKRRR